MDPRVLAQLERVASADIQLLNLPQIDTHFVFERGGFAILVEKKGQGFGAIGSAGLLGEHGLAPLVNGHFVAKGFRRAATEAETTALREFSTALQAALS